MAIDPMLYRKISGRSGDPMDAYGESLAQNAATRSNRNTAVPGDARVSALKFRLIMKIVIGVAILGAFAVGLLTRK